MTAEKLPITGLTVGDVTPAVLVCGDPGRAERITARLSGVRLLGARREYAVYAGQYGSLPLTVASHGVGAPGAAVAFEELIAAGARTMVRVGTCGGLQAGVQSGHLVVATAAVQYTGYGRETVPPGYPAVADAEVTLALRRHATGGDRPWHTGIVLTRDNFYAGVTTPGAPDYAAMTAAGVQAVEMECAALFLVGSLRGIRTGAILAVDGNVMQGGEKMDTYQPHRQVVQQAVEQAIDVALRAMAGLVAAA